MGKIISILVGTGIIFVIFFFLACGAIALVSIYVAVGVMFVIYLFTKGINGKKSLLLFFFSFVAMSMAMPMPCQSSINPNSPKINETEEEEYYKLPMSGHAVLRFANGSYFAYIANSEVVLVVMSLPEEAYKEKNIKIITSVILSYSFGLTELEDGSTAITINFFSSDPKINKILGNK